MLTRTQRNSMNEMSKAERSGTATVDRINKANRVARSMSAEARKTASEETRMRIFDK